MKKYLLTILNGYMVVTNKERTHMAQPLYVEEALVEGLTLEEMIEEYEGFMEEWLPIKEEYGWGEVLKIHESDKEFKSAD